jgi:hypothetical protein
MTSEWLPAAALAAGVAGTWGAQVWRERQTSDRESRAREHERQVASDAFQRETLLELQEAMGAAMHTTTQLSAIHRRAFNHTGRYGRDPDPDELDIEGRDRMGHLSRLKARVLDADLRQRVTHAQNLMVRATMPALADQVDAEVARAAELAYFDSLNALSEAEVRLGEVLRALL